MDNVQQNGPSGLRQNYRYQNKELDHFVQRAIALRSQGRSREAVDLCMKGLEQYPLSIDLRCQLGLACFEKGDIESARRELEEVARTIERNRSAFQILKMIYKQKSVKGSKQGRPGEEGLKSSLAGPLEKKTRTLADLYRKQGYIQEALEIYKELLREAPDDHYLKKMVQELTPKLEKSKTNKGPGISPDRGRDGKDEVLGILHSWQVAIQKRRKERA